MGSVLGSLLRQCCALSLLLSSLLLFLLFIVDHSVKVQRGTQELQLQEQALVDRRKG
jgi:hypothetical protein